MESDAIKGTSDNPIETTLKMDNDEQIRSIEGSLSLGNIVQIFITTNYGQYIECGSKIGENFFWEFSSTQSLCELKVSVARYVTLLFAVYVDHIPEIVNKPIIKIPYPNKTKPCIYLICYSNDI